MEHKLKVSCVVKDLNLVHSGQSRHYYKKITPFIFDRKSRQLLDFIEELKAKPDDPVLLYHLTFDASLDPIVEELEEICKSLPLAREALERRFLRNLQDLKV